MQNYRFDRWNYSIFVDSRQGGCCAGNDQDAAEECDRGRGPNGDLHGDRFGDMPLGVVQERLAAHLWDDGENGFLHDASDDGRDVRHEVHCEILRLHGRNRDCALAACRAFSRASASVIARHHDAAD